MSFEGLDQSPQKPSDKSSSFLSRISMRRHAERDIVIQRDIVIPFVSVRPSIRLSVALWYCN